MKILRLNARTFPMIEPERTILEVAGVEVVETELFSECNTPEKFDGVMIVSAYLHAEDIRRLTKCKIIARLGNGCDKIDLTEAARQGIAVANVPDSFTAEVADHTMTLMLSALRKLKQHEELMRQGRRPNDTFGLRRISALTLGLIGFGNIGRMVAMRASAFGMRIIVSDPVLTDAAAVAAGVERASFDTILETADVISLLCPLLPSTRKMMAMKEFRRMKPTAILINTARGELVNEAELADALEGGVIAWAGVDVFGSLNVFAEGGFPTDHPFFRVKNIQLTPHVSANAEEAKIETFCRAARYAVDGANGILPPFIVNQSQLKEFGPCRIP